MFPPLAIELSWLAAGFVVLGLAILAILALSGGNDDSWSAARRGGSAGEDVVCPRCHHRTPPDATACPECGKELG